MVVKRVEKYYKGLHFCDSEFMGVLDEGKHRFLSLGKRHSIDIVSEKAPWIAHEELELMVRSGKLAGKAEVIDLKENEQALVWVDGKLNAVVDTGLYALWNSYYDIKVEKFSTKEVWLKHEDLDIIVRSGMLSGKARTFELNSDERAIVWIDGQPELVSEPGFYALWATYHTVQLETFTVRDAWLQHSKLKSLVKAGLLEGEAEVIELKDSERAIVSFDGRFERILSRGLYAIWNSYYNIDIERFDVEEARFEHAKLDDLLNSGLTVNLLDEFVVSEGHLGVYFENGELQESLEPGRYAFWKSSKKVKLYHKDMRETVLDVAGQDIMSGDKVTLRLNAVLTYRICDVIKAVLSTADASQSLYRETQLALREVVGSRELDGFLTDRDEVERELKALVAGRAEALGLQVISFGIRDVILPGEMKELLNKVTEAKKAAEANLIARREEVAAMRSQANSAKMLENNPGVIKLRELEILEKLVTNSNLSIILGEEKLTEKIAKMM